MCALYILPARYICINPTPILLIRNFRLLLYLVPIRSGTATIDLFNTLVSTWNMKYISRQVINPKVMLRRTPECQTCWSKPIFPQLLDYSLCFLCIADLKDGFN